MRKQFLIFLILIFILGLVPVNFSNAITQNQINSEVQIVCTDGNNNWFSGSGTIIDPKGIILTNRHVIEGAYKNICFIGFLESINKEPNFGSAEKPNLAEVKYVTTTKDMDAAVLYFDNKSNKIFPYVDIWNSNSNNLKFGDKIEVVGYPSIGGSTITYTSGDFSGFGSKSDETNNYIKTTAPIEHGNSGGSAYASNGDFLGIPSMVIPGQLNSISYILSVNSIKKWLSLILGADYKNIIIKQKPIINNTPIFIQKNITPPSIDSFEFLFYGINSDGTESFNSSSNKNNSFVNDYHNKIRINMDKPDEVYSVIYSYSKKLDDLFNKQNTFEYLPKNPCDKPNEICYYYRATDEITLNNGNGVYYIGVKLKDKIGNISNARIFTYVYEDANFLKLKNIKFYSDKKMIGNYSFDLIKESSAPRETQYKHDESNYYDYCLTNKKNISIKWQYDKNYQSYDVKLYNEHDNVIMMDEKSSIIKDGIYKTSSNKYEINGLDKSNEGGFLRSENNKLVGDHVCLDNNCGITGKVSVLQLKPRIGDDVQSYLGGKYTVIKFIYNPDLPYDLICGGRDITKGDYIDKDSIYRGIYYTLKPGNNLVEDGKEFDVAQQKIFDSFLDSNKEIIINNDIDLKFSKRLKGKILIQIESHGEAWYVNPKDGKRYYMANGEKAYNVMRNFGVGITNKNLEKIKTNKTFAKSNSGKIFLQVEAKGEAFYIDFSGNANYLKDGNAAYIVMRNLGLGITNSDLSKISAGEL